MKPIKFILLIALLLSAGSLNAQRKKELKEIKGTKDTFIMEINSPIYYVIYKKKNIFMDNDSPYLFYDIKPKIWLQNVAELDRLVKKYFVPYFKKYNGEDKITSSLFLSFFSDMDGKIIDFHIAYPKELGVLPIEVIEDYGCALLQSKVSIGFNKNDKRFEGSEWVHMYFLYDSEKLRKGLTE